MTVNGLVRIADGVDRPPAGTITNNGTVEQNGFSGETAVELDGNVTLTGTGVWKMSNDDMNRFRRFGATTPTLTNDVQHTIQGAGNIGNGNTGVVNKGVIIADQVLPLIIQPSAALATNQAGGVWRAHGRRRFAAQQRRLRQSGNDRGAQRLERDLSTILPWQSTTWPASSPAAPGGPFPPAAARRSLLRGSNITQIAAGTDSRCSVAPGRCCRSAGRRSIRRSRRTTARCASSSGRNYTAGPGLGACQWRRLGARRRQRLARRLLTNSAGGEIFGFGTITPRPINSGTIRAVGGTLTLAAGIQGGSGTVQVDAGATLDLSGAALASSADSLIHNGAGLNLGAQNFSVGVDYQNGNFGTGNAFNARANVSGTGQILASPGVTQTLGGSVTNGGTATATMAFGNVHVGSPSTLNYQINNVGAAGPKLRGAIQTTAGGANLTDGRLSGAGVTAGNFGPINAGANSGNLAVTFSAATAGALTGQQVRIVNNFDNVAEQTLQITGAAYRLAAPSTHTPEPVNFGIVHVGDSLQQALSITNSAASDGFSERLNASIGSPTGSATTNAGSFSGLARQDRPTIRAWRSALIRRRPGRSRARRPSA